MSENVAYYPQSAYLESCKIFVGENSYELKNMITEISYYEDIYNFCVSGYIKIEDSQGFVESLQLTGNEYLEINFGKVNSQRTCSQGFNQPLLVLCIIHKHI